MSDESAPNCLVCLDTGWVCEKHPDRPWDGPHACGCGGAGSLCPECGASLLKGGVPALPTGTRVVFDKDGWRH